MKLIDIANKIDNGEIKLPARYRIKDLKYGIYDHLEFNTSRKAYWLQNNSSCIVTFDDLFREIEVIEDKSEKIDKLDNRNYDEVNQCYCGTKVLGENRLVDKINEIIDRLNKLLEKSDT